MNVGEGGLGGGSPIHRSAAKERERSEGSDAASDQVVKFLDITFPAEVASRVGLRHELPTAVTGHQGERPEGTHGERCNSAQSCWSRKWCVVWGLTYFVQGVLGTLDKNNRK